MEFEDITLYNNLSIMRRYFDQYFSNIDIQILFDNTLFTIRLYDNDICNFYDDVPNIERLFKVEDGDLFFYIYDLSYTVFKILFDRINRREKITCDDMIWLHNISDEQLARFINIILTTSEDNKYSLYRKSNDVHYLRKLLYMNGFFCI